MKLRMLELSLAILVTMSPGQVQASEADGLVALEEGRHREALRVFEAILVSHPDSVSALYGKGLALSRLSDYGGAVAVLEKAASFEPTSAAAHRQLAILYSRLGRRESARASYERAHSLAPIHETDAILMGRALRNAGLLREARAVLEPAGVSDGVRFELGLLEMEDGRYEKAAEILGPVSRSLGTASAHYELARSLEAVGETERARQLYRLVLDLTPYHRRARFRLGNLLLHAGEAEEAERVLRGYEPFRRWDRQVQLLKAMVSSGTLAPEDKKQKTRLLVDLLLEGNALAEAERVIESARADYPEEMRFELAHARWLLLSGRLDEAFVALEPVLDRGTTLPDAFWVSAQLHMRRGRIAEALEDYETLLSLSPAPPPRVHLDIGTAYTMSGRFSEAISHFEQALASEPRLARAHADLGLALATTNRRDEAEAHYREALKLNRDLIAAQQGLGSLLLEQGKTLEAVELFQASIALQPRGAVLRRNLAFALERAGRVAEALEELEKAREIEAHP